MNEIGDIDETVVIPKTGIITDNMRPESRKERDVGLALGIFVVGFFISMVNEMLYASLMEIEFSPIFEDVILILIFGGYLIVLLFIAYLQYKFISALSTFDFGKLQCCKHARLSTFLGTIAFGIFGGAIVYAFYRLKISKFIDGIHTDKSLVNTIGAIVAIFLIIVAICILIIGYMWEEIGMLS